MTIVAGRVVAENGRILTVDVAAIRAEVAAEWPRCPRRVPRARRRA